MFRLLWPKPKPPPPPPFVFLDAPRLFNLTDGDLELVEPDHRHIDALLAASNHPQTQKEMPIHANATRESVLQFLAQTPHGHTPPNPPNTPPGYTFWMHTSHPDLPISIAGSISLRLGHSTDLDYYLGHIGYHVLPPAQGHRYAQRACQLLLPLARAHGQKTLYLTSNPGNLPSRRTIERLGATFLTTVTLPPDNPLYTQGDRQKCRYRLDL